MFYTGIDQHKRDSYLATYDADGHLVKQSRPQHTRRAHGVPHRRNARWRTNQSSS